MQKRNNMPISLSGSILLCTNNKATFALHIVQSFNLGMFLTANSDLAFITTNVEI